MPSPSRKRQAGGSRLARTLNDSFHRTPMTAPGRNDSPASGSFREANFQRRLSGGEFEELSVATRPRAAVHSTERPMTSNSIKPPPATQRLRIASWHGGSTI